MMREVIQKYLNEDLGLCSSVLDPSKAYFTIWCQFALLKMKIYKF